MSKNNLNPFNKIDSVPGALECFQNFIFRTPVYSFNLLEKKYRLTLDIELLNDKLFQEAIYLASSDFYKESKWSSQEKILGTKDALKLRISLLKYFTRMAIRCTPFGLFAGCGVGEIGGNSNIVPVPTCKFKSSTRLDMDYLCALIKDIENLERIKRQLKFFPNTSIYSSGSGLRYTEYFYAKTKRKYNLTAVEGTDYLQKVLDEAKNGRTIDELAGLLVDEDIALEVAREYVGELVHNQLLVSELEPAVTGDELLGQTIKKLEKLVGTQELVVKLINIDEGLKTIDRKSVGRPVTCYQNIKEKLKQFQTKYNEKYLFQSDLFIKPETATLSIQIIEEVKKAIGALNRLTTKTENPLLKKFREEFYKKYEDEEVPLTVALDVETGIGFGNIDGQRGDLSPLLNGIPFYGNPVGSVDIKLNAVQSFLIKNYDEFLTNPDSEEIVITKKDLSAFPENWDDLPGTFSAMAEIIRTEESPDGPLVLLKQAGGSSAANLLGRFCYIDKQIEDFVKEITGTEQQLNPGKILAEIVHLPESRTGNILMRPTLRNYEIPYLANTSVDKNNVIPLTDLMVSAPQGRTIKLRSIKFNKEVLPRLTCAHNYSNNALPVYQFLCMMQTQELRGGVGFNWGPVLENKHFLPRVRYEHAVLSPATWNISADDTKQIPAITDSRFFEKASLFRKEKKIPDRALLVQGDNKMLIDFNCLLSVQMLFSEVKKRSFRLEEFLFDDEYPLVKRGEEFFTNQLIMCFYKNKQ